MRSTNQRSAPRLTPPRPAPRFRVPMDAPDIHTRPSLRDAPAEAETAPESTLETTPEPARAASVDVVTFGCRLNAYESEVVKTHAEAAGRTDTVIVNTCAVTGEAVRQARQTIRKLRRERPGARLVVTGCAAQIDPDMFAAMDEVDEVVGNHDKMKAETWTTAATGAVADVERVRVNDIMSITETAGHLIDGLADRARAYEIGRASCRERV